MNRTTEEKNYIHQVYKLTEAQLGPIKNEFLNLLKRIEIVIANFLNGLPYKLIKLESYVCVLKSKSINTKMHQKKCITVWLYNNFLVNCFKGKRTFRELHQIDIFISTLNNIFKVFYHVRNYNDIAKMAFVHLLKMQC